MTAGGTSDISSGVLAAFKTNMAQSTNFITHNIYTGGTNSTTPITFYKYTSVSSQAPGTKVQLAKIDTDGNFYEGTTKLSEKYAAIGHTHGNLSNDGKITSTSEIATGDKIVIVDSDTTAESKITGASITFDTSKTGYALTQAGTWAAFNNYSHPTTSGNKHIPSGGSSGQFLG